MTKNSISLGRAVAGVCMILAIAAVIGLLGSLAPPSSSNRDDIGTVLPDNNLTPDGSEDDSILKIEKDTYELFGMPSSEINSIVGKEFFADFTATIYLSNDVNTPVEILCSSILFETINNEVYLCFRVVSADSDIFVEYGSPMPIYNFDTQRKAAELYVGKNVMITMNETIYCVDEDLIKFGAWFDDSTSPKYCAIKPGIYKLKENIDLASVDYPDSEYASVAYNFDFLVMPGFMFSTFEEQEKYVISSTPDSAVCFSSMHFSSDPDGLSLKFYTEENLFTGNYVKVYTPEDGWFALSKEFPVGSFTEEGITVEILYDFSRWGQIIEIPYEQEVYESVMEFFEFITDPIS